MKMIKSLLFPLRQQPKCVPLLCIPHAHERAQHVYEIYYAHESRKFISWLMISKDNKRKVDQMKISSA